MYAALYAAVKHFLSEKKNTGVLTAMKGLAADIKVLTGTKFGEYPVQKVWIRKKKNLFFPPYSFYYRLVPHICLIL